MLLEAAFVPARSHFPQKYPHHEKVETEAGQKNATGIHYLCSRGIQFLCPNRIIADSRK